MALFVKTGPSAVLFMERTISLTTLERVRQTIEQYRMIDRKESVVVGVSGGADSMALLHILLTLQRQEGYPAQVLAAHVQHNLRGEESREDEAYVRKICREWDVELFVHQVDVAALAGKQKTGLEETGRQVRYAFFKEVAHTHDPCRIATAHNRKDNMETVLLHLTRGSGLQGGCGIAPVRERLIRPLLFCSREEIETYCREKGIIYRQDSTNQDIVYSRNRIRKEVIPSLACINSRVEEAFLRFSQVIRQDNDYLQQQADQLLSKAEEEAHRYSISPLAAAHPAVTTRALQMMANRESCAALETVHLRQLQALLLQEGAVTLPGGRQAVSRGGWLWFLPDKAMLSSPLPVQIGECYEFCAKTYSFSILSLEEYEKQKKVNKILLKNAMDYAMIHHSLYWRSRQEGDRYKPIGRPTKTLKKLLNEIKVPVWNRDMWPVLCDQTGIVWVAGCGCDQRVAVTAATRKVLLIMVQ